MSDRTMVNAALFYLLTVVTKAMINQGNINKSELSQYCDKALSSLPDSNEYDEMRNVIRIFVDTVINSEFDHAYAEKYMDDSQFH